MDVRAGYKESWVLKNWCFWTVVLEKTLTSPLECKEIQPVHPKGNQSWIFVERTDAEAETPILWPPDVKNWLIWKAPDAGKDWRWEEKGITEDEMVGWHHQLNGDEFEWTLGVGDGQGGLAYYSPWVAKSWTWLSTWTEPRIKMSEKFPSPVLALSYLTLTEILTVNHRQHSVSSASSQTSSTFPNALLSDELDKWIWSQRPYLSLFWFVWAYSLGRRLILQYTTPKLGYPGGPAVKNLPAMQESLGWEDLLEKEVVTQFSIVA